MLCSCALFQVVPASLTGWCHFLLGYPEPTFKIYIHFKMMVFHILNHLKKNPKNTQPNNLCNLLATVRKPSLLLTEHWIVTGSGGCTAACRKRREFSAQHLVYGRDAGGSFKRGLNSLRLPNTNEVAIFFQHNLGQPTAYSRKSSAPSAWSQLLAAWLFKPASDSLVKEKWW